jgi:hypothetical protein
MPFKRMKAIARKVGRVVKKRYFKGKGYGNPKLGRMTKDIMFLKGIVNAEKKRITISQTAQIGPAQVFANSNGNIVTDITPIPVQNSTFTGRNGDA